MVTVSLTAIAWLCTNTVFAQDTAQAVAASTDSPVPSLNIAPAKIEPAAKMSMILAATMAGNRIVAVGERGIVLLSDDAGASYRQAKSVPISATLTAAHFIDGKTGWAAGHWGAILKTNDGGETWQLQRHDLSVDQPFFSIYFKDEHNGWAAGLWSLLQVTHDGGATWNQVSLPVPPGASKADRNLFDIFPDRDGGLAIAAERGTIVHSVDGETWTYVDTGYKGSLWTGVVVDDGTWLAGGLRGTILRSVDHGKTWQTSQTGAKSSITGVIPGKNNTVLAVALDGIVLTSRDSGVSFTTMQRADQMAINAAVIGPDGRLLEFSNVGPLKVESDTNR